MEGTRIVRTSIYPMIVHIITPTPAFRSFIITGSAIMRVLPLRTEKRAPMVVQERAVHL
ncbi:hypothetical protein CTK_C04320 [Clostridium tyrobutyricum]|nr:hypothetical protein CTK_C04320 [Clostridium tyrobutyricum]